MKSHYLNGEFGVGEYLFEKEGYLDLHYSTWEV